MTVTLELNSELEQGLRALARERGVSLDVCLQEIVAREVRAAKSNTLELPARSLGDMGSLHRRDIYDDATVQGKRDIADELRKYFAEVDAVRKPVSDEEAEEIIGEAMRSVRPGYSEIPRPIG